MKTLRRWVIRIFAGLLILVIIVTGMGVWMVRRSWPEVGGTIKANGLQSPVQIVRDQWGVPNIYAQNEHDLFYAQGYVHAQDRLVQMDVLRRLSNGTMSEAFGQGTAGVDYFMRTLGLERSAKALWANMDAENRAILQAYSDGINAYVNSHRDRLPVDLAIMGVGFRAWTPVDTLTFGNATAFWMSSNYRMELLRAQIIASLGKDVAEKALPSYDKNMPLVIPDATDLYTVTGKSSFNGLQNLYDRGQRAGSNGWVVASSHTTTNGAILANDTHLGSTMPSSWYENGLHGGRFDVVGYSFPGVPLVLVGHNQHIAWGETTLFIDNMDFYIEKLDDPETPTRYLYKDQWYDLQIIHDTYLVRGAKPVDIDILMTRHGPLLNAAMEAVSGVQQSEQPMALRWTLAEGNGLFQSLVKLNLAGNWQEFHAALSEWDLPCLNFVYADTAGNIGYHTAGRVPIRAAGHQGTVPVPGWTGEYEWRGFVPADAMLATLNPKAGYVVTANNKVTDDTPYPLAYDWMPGFRAKRIGNLLSSKDRFSIADMQQIQADTYSLPAEAMRPYLLAIRPANSEQSQALELLKDWDLRLETDRTGASIYETWTLYTMRHLMTDLLGTNIGGWYLSGNYETQMAQAMPVLVNLMGDSANTAWDDPNTPVKETRDDVLQQSLTEALAWLKQNYGANPQGWTWGRLHTVSFEHNAFGKSGIPIMMRIFNSSVIPARGDQFTVSAADYNWAQPFAMVQGVAQRMILDMSNLDNSLSVVSTGQSEQVFHPHREDQMAMWQNMQYRPMPFTREAVNKYAKTTLTLTP